MSNSSLGPESASGCGELWPAPPCGWHGTCVNGSCVCENGWAVNGFVVDGATTCSRVNILVRASYASWLFLLILNHLLGMRVGALEKRKRNKQDHLAQLMMNFGTFTLICTVGRATASSANEIFTSRLNMFFYESSMAVLLAGFGVQHVKYILFVKKQAGRIHFKSGKKRGALRDAITIEDQTKNEIFKLVLHMVGRILIALPYVVFSVDFASTADIVRVSMAVRILIQCFGSWQIYGLWKVVLEEFETAKSIQEQACAVNPGGEGTNSSEAKVLNLINLTIAEAEGHLRHLPIFVLPEIMQVPLVLAWPFLLSLLSYVFPIVALLVTFSYTVLVLHRLKAAKNQIVADESENRWAVVQSKKSSGDSAASSKQDV